jgi:hypothetical protein
MKHRFLKTLLTVVLIVQFIFVRASECYHYHTRTTNEIKIKKGEVFWIQTVKDPNGISIASYKKTLIRNVKADNLHFVSENSDGIIIANTEYYYWLDKNPYTFEDKGLRKIIESKKISAKFGENTFLIDGKWTHIDYNPYTNKTDFTVIPNFPNDAVLIHHSETGRGSSYLIKDKQKVYSYDEREKKLTIISNLTASKTQYYETSWAYDNHFLYDDNTFYLIGINFDDPQDITSELKTMELKHPFTKAKIIQINEDYFLDFGDGKIWTYSKDGIELEGGGNVHFYPIENARYYAVCNMIFYNKKIYNSSWDLLNSDYNYGIDITLIKHHEKLKELFSQIYWDGENLYQLQYEPNKHFTILPKNNEINYNNLEQKYNNAIWSYRKSLSPFVIDGRNIFRWTTNTDDLQKEKIIRSYQNIKDLKLAYLIDRQIFIENEWIDNIMDFSTSEFIGSTVVVISGCDGGKGQYPVVVEYNYYFKDKNDVYLYHSGKKQLEKLNIGNPQEYSETTFIEKILKDKNYG